MDRLLRLGGGLPAPLNQGPPPSDAPVVDTAEQVYCLHFIIIRLFCYYSTIYHIFQGVHFIIGTFKNVKTRPSWSTHGSHGFDVR